MKKRILSMALILVLMFALTPQMSVSAISPTSSGTVAERIQQLRNRFPRGSFFSANGAACVQHIPERNTCNNCSLIHTMNARWGTTPFTWNVWTCVAFARFGFWYIFGIAINNGGYSGIAAPGTTRIAPSQMRIGDIAVWNNWHWAIYLGNGRYFHSNMGGTPNRVEYNTSFNRPIPDWAFRANNWDAINNVAPPPPPPPTNRPIVTVNGRSVTVSWNNVPSATSFDVILVQPPWGTADITHRASRPAGSTSHTFTNVPFGVYSAFVITRPNEDRIQSPWSGSFEVVPLPTNMTFSVNRGDNSDYLTDEFVVINARADNAGWYRVVIRRNGTVVLDSNTGFPFTFNHGGNVGQYQIYATAHNSDGHIQSRTINFTVHPRQPAYLAYQVNPRAVTGDNVRLSESPLSRHFTTETLPRGHVFQSTGKLINSYGNTWVRLTHNGRVRWVPRGDLALPAQTWSGNGHQYQAFYEVLTWSEARERAESMGGHLATITSQEEWDFVRGLVGVGSSRFSAYWLGGTDAIQEGTWEWV